MKNKDLVAGLLIGGGVLYFATTWIQNQGRNNIPPISQAPKPPPRSKADEWQSWVALIFSIYGNVKELWEPGGPFYGMNKDDIYDEVNPDDYSNIV